MHPLLPPLTIGETVLKESDDLEILGLIFESKMAFGKYLSFRAASQRLGILKSLRVFNDWLLLELCFRGTVLRSGYCSQLECNIARRQSIAVLFTLNIIWSNPMHPLCGVLPMPYVHSSSLVAHRYTSTNRRCRTSQYRRIFYFPSISLWNDIDDPSFDGGTRVLRAGLMLFNWPKLLVPCISSTVCPFSIFFSVGLYCGAGVFVPIGSQSLSPSPRVLHFRHFFLNNNNNK